MKIAFIILIILACIMPSSASAVPSPAPSFSPVGMASDVPSLSPSTYPTSSPSAYASSAAPTTEFLKDPQAYLRRRDGFIVLFQLCAYPPALVLLYLLWRYVDALFESNGVADWCKYSSYGRIYREIDQDHACSQRIMNNRKEARDTENPISFKDDMALEEVHRDADYAVGEMENIDIEAVVANVNAALFSYGPSDTESETDYESDGDCDDANIGHLFTIDIV